MPMQIIRADIATLTVDAIVNSANCAPTFASGVDRRIYMAAGPEKLLAERSKIGYLEVGNACVTPAFNLNAKYIFHVSSPCWIDGNHNEVQLLRLCYEKVLALAIENHCQSIAIPLLATGNFRFPHGVGLEIATSVIRDFLNSHDLEIILVVFNRRSFTLAKEIADEVKAYIDDNYIDSYMDEMCMSEAVRPTITHDAKDSAPLALVPSKKATKNILCSDSIADESDEDFYYSRPNTLQSYNSRRYRPFSDYVIQLMNKKGIKKSSDVYNACGMSKQTWAKMMKPDHNPSKNTVMLLCIGLKLNLDEARDLMMQAGYAFSPNKKLDVIVSFCISKKLDIFDTNNIIFNEFGKTLSNCG